MNELCACRNLLELLKLSASDSLTPLSSKVSDGFAVIMDTVVCCPEPAKELWCSSLNSHPSQNYLCNTGFKQCVPN